MCAERLKVTVGVCGGIAAYKAVELVRLLQEAGLDPHVVMTRAAEEFIRPLTFAADEVNFTSPAPGHYADGPGPQPGHNSVSSPIPRRRPL